MAAADEPVRVSEIFASIQGESSHAGWPCVLIRLAGCPLACTYCDTRYAAAGGRPTSIDDLLTTVRGFGLPLVEVTGGEPLAQAPSRELIRRLLDVGYQVLVETGGGASIAGVDGRATIILDIKTPGSGMHERQDWENLKHLRPHDEIKYVITSRADYEWARSHLRETDLSAQHVVHFSPVALPGGDDDAGSRLRQELAAWILEDRLRVRLNLQLHVCIWGHGQRGV